MDFKSEKLKSAFQKYKDQEITLEDFLTCLPNDTDRDFEIGLTELIVNVSNIQNELQSVLDRSSQIDDQVLYPAFYGMCIYHRRMKDYTKLDNLIMTYNARFGDKPMYQHVFSLALKSKGGSENIFNAVLSAKSATRKVNDNAGVFHNYAEAVAVALEEGIITDFSYLEDATQNINIAMSLDPHYAKYYCTYGRILALQGDYSNSRAMIKRAIDMEDSGKRDYALRIGDYQHHLIGVAIKSNIKKFSNRVEDFEKKLYLAETRLGDATQKATSRHLEFLAFFAALIGFTVGSIQIAVEQPLEKAAQLILVLSGGLLLAFSGFSLVLHGSNHFFRTLVMFGLGVLIVALTLYVMPY